MILSAEPGDNTVNETYNGMAFEVEEHPMWSDSVPHQGMFCTTYTTQRNGGLLALRLPLCRALLAPGKGRYVQQKGALNERALKACGDDEKLLLRYKLAADAGRPGSKAPDTTPREELIRIILGKELGSEITDEAEAALREDLDGLEMGAIQERAKDLDHPTKHVSSPQSRTLVTAGMLCVFARG